LLLETELSKSHVTAAEEFVSKSVTVSCCALSVKKFKKDLLPKVLTLERDLDTIDYANAKLALRGKFGERL